MILKFLSLKKFKIRNDRIKWMFRQDLRSHQLLLSNQKIHCYYLNEMNPTPMKLVILSPPYLSPLRFYSLTSLPAILGLYFLAIL